MNSDAPAFPAEADIDLFEAALSAERGRPHQRVRFRLEATGHAWLRQVKCHYSAGIVTLEGCVPTFYLRQIAQRLARELPGVVQVVDRLEVAYLT